MKANAPSMRQGRSEAAKLRVGAKVRQFGRLDFYKLALNVHHRDAEKVLRAPALPVGEVTPDVVNLCGRMVEITQRDPQCRGIAAPQVNRAVRVFTVKDNDGMVYCFIDPTVTPRVGSLRQTEWEGCFSLPGEKVRVERWSAVEVVGLAPSGHESRIVFTGVAARAAQHEMEHLDGILIDAHGPRVLVEQFEVARA